MLKTLFAAAALAATLVVPAAAEEELVKVRFVTDWKAYADWALEILNATPGLSWTAEAADDWRAPPADHVVTRYEEKRLGDTPPIFLEFVRT